MILQARMQIIITLKVEKTHLLYLFVDNQFFAFIIIAVNISLKNIKMISSDFFVYYSLYNIKIGCRNVNYILILKQYFHVMDAIK